MVSTSTSCHNRGTLAESLVARHSWMIISEIATFVIYAVSMVVLPQYFGEPSRIASFGLRKPLSSEPEQICRSS